MNPRFFPDAIELVESDEEGITGRFQSVSAAYLQREEAESIYPKCGDILHASHKFPTEEQVNSRLEEAVDFCAKAKNLLKQFEIDVSGKGSLVLGQLNLDLEKRPEVFHALLNR